MKIEELVEIIYEDLNAQITSISRTGDRDISMTLECDDWKGGDGRHRFELHCRDVERHTLTIGAPWSLDFRADHPLLYEYAEPQGSLYFSSAPQSPEQVFYVAYDFFSSRFGGWVEPSALLHGTSREIVAHLKAGCGLLARGPVSALAELCTRLQGQLKTNVIESYRRDPAFRVLMADEKWAICKSVGVVQLN